MKRSTFVIFGLFAILFAVLIPAWAITREGGVGASPEAVPSSLEQGKELFAINCGSCHTLEKAGTDGIVGPNLDDLLAPPTAADADPKAIEPRVLNAVDQGVGGRMPADILSGDQAEQVASFVAECAGPPSGRCN